MRIAHVANFYGPASGGLRTTMHELGRGYLARDHQFLMVVPGAEDTDVETEFGRRITVASSRIPGFDGYRMITRVGYVRELLDRFAPDVLEVSDRTTLHPLASWATQRGIPSMFFAHERADGVLLRHLPRWIAPRKLIKRLARAHSRKTAAQFTTLVGTTQYAATEFKDIRERVSEIPLGVDLDLFNPALRDPQLRSELAQPGQALLVMASRLSAEKRPDLAINAVRELRRRGRAVTLVCAGTGPLENDLRASANDLPVQFLGFVRGRERLASLLATADAVVAPGPIETFGLTALEALAAGTPAVVNATSALPEVVGDAGAVAHGTPQSFADAIERVLDSPAPERRAVARARAHTMPWHTTVDTLLNIHYFNLTRDARIQSVPQVSTEPQLTGTQTAPRPSRISR